MLRKRGIHLYAPTKTASGKVVKITTKIRKSKEAKRDGNSSRDSMTIVEKFAVVEYSDNNKVYVAESMFPVTDISVGEIVEVKYDSKNREKVWIVK